MLNKIRTVLSVYLFVGLGSIVCLSSMNSAVAVPLVVNNNSFETLDCDIPSACSNGSFTNNAIDGWTITGDSGLAGGSYAAGVFDPGLYGVAGGYVATDGDQVAYSLGGTISQITTNELTADTWYTLSVDVGDRPDTAFPGYTIGLYANDVLLAEDHNSLAPESGFLTSIISFLAPAGFGELGQFIEVRLSSFGGQTNFDNVRLDALQNVQLNATHTVPEPASLSIFGFGLIGLVWARRRRLAWARRRRLAG